MNESGISLSKSQAFGELAFRAAEYKEALIIWEALSPVPASARSYRMAKAYTEEFPEKIKWLADVGREDEIISAFESNRDYQLTVEYCQYIAKAYSKQHRQEEAITLLSERGAGDALESLIKDELKDSSNPLVLYGNSELVRIRTRDGKWRESIELIRRGKFPSDVALKLSSVLVYELAQSDELAKESPNEYVADYLRRTYIDAAWNSSVSIEVVGAAIERGGRIVDALEFYESIWKTKKIGSPENDHFAKQRWLTCKYRQVAYSQERKRVLDAARQKEDADRQRKLWALSINDAPDFPAITPQDDPLPGDLNKTRMRKLTEDQVSAIKELLKVGWSAHRIAKTLGVPIQEIETVAGIQL